MGRSPLWRSTCSDRMNVVVEFTGRFVKPCEAGQSRSTRVQFEEAAGSTEHVILSYANSAVKIRASQIWLCK